jgi:hypothetical protein
MGRLTLAIVAAALGLVAVPAAIADEPGIVHLRFSGTFTDPNFCGTGRTVTIADSVHLTLFTNPNRPGVDESLTLEGRTVFTDVGSGATVVAHFAGARQIAFPGDPGHEIDTDVGLRSQLVRRGPGGLITRDAGFATVDFKFAIGSGQIVEQHGPHPFLEALLAGNDPFCGLVTSGLA